MTSWLPETPKYRKIGSNGILCHLLKFPVDLQGLASASSRNIFPSLLWSLLLPGSQLILPFRWYFPRLPLEFSSFSIHWISFCFCFCFFPLAFHQQPSFLFTHILSWGSHSRLTVLLRTYGLRPPNRLLSSPLFHGCQKQISLLLLDILTCLSDSHLGLMGLTWYTCSPFSLTSAFSVFLIPGSM